MQNTHCWTYEIQSTNSLLVPLQTSQFVNIYPLQAAVTSHNTHMTYAELLQLVPSHVNTPVTYVWLPDILDHRTHQVLALFTVYSPSLTSCYCQEQVFQPD